jgi:two-component system, OmpR family, sensor kinase
MNVSLRARVLAGVLALIAGALLVAAVSIYEEQRSFLLGRFDQRVIGAAAPISYQLGVSTRLLPRSTHTGHGGQRPPITTSLAKGLTGFLPSGTYGELVGAHGLILRGPVVIHYDDERVAPPALPARLPISAVGTTPSLFTVDSTQGSRLRYRVAALALAAGSGTLVVAVPQGDIDQALDRLVLAEAVIGGVLLLVLGAMGWVVIRLALRPLDQMGRVASAIAGGDLSRRVSPAAGKTEVGRLGMSLNRMLERIEEAFADRENAEARRKQFLSDASHELRTPLASIRGYTELFRLGAIEDPEELERAMDRIESEATRMGVLVDDLLTLARLDELPEARRELVDLVALATSAVADARAAAPDRTISLDAYERVTVAGEPNMLRQVFANLLGNAVLHTPRGTAVELRVAVDGRSAVIEVRDHGPGLPPGAAEHVFERFWRADGGRARGRGGSGLGLAIVREVVAFHHGSVEAGNHPEGGAVFRVRLSRVPEPAGVDPEARGGPPRVTPTVG